jgi:ABC-type glycerol-3-phosphate transport system substrate-binding protein
MDIPGDRKPVLGGVSIPRMMLILPAMLVASLVLACGATPSPTSPALSGPTPSVTVPFDLPITIAIAGRFTELELAVLDDQINAFEAGNPDLKVEIVELAGRADQRREKIADLLGQGDSSIDLYIVDSTWLAGYVAPDQLSPLDELISTQGVVLEEFFPVTLEANTLNGQLYALPWTADAGLLYYRQDLLDLYGYAVPTTWVELQRIALDIKGKEDLPYGYVWQGSAYESLTCNTLEFLWAYGGDVSDDQGEISFDSPQSRTALRQMRDLIASGASPGEVTTYDEGQTLTAFQNGEAIFMHNWSYAWARLNDGDSAVRGLVGVAHLPVPCQFEQSLALSAHSQHPAEALRLMAFLVEHEQQAGLAEGMGTPPALEAVYHDADLLRSDPFWENLHAALMASRPRPQSEVYPTLSEAIYTEVHRMLTGDQDVDTTAAHIQRRIEAIVQEH